MKILVVGGTGVLGLPTVAALVAGGHSVRATARTPAKAAQIEAVGAAPVDFDVFDLVALREAMRGCDAVLRLTTKIPSSLKSMRSASAWIETNRLRSVGAQRVVDAMLAESVGLYVAESFYAVYADAGDRFVDETFPIDDGGLAVPRAVLESESHARRLTSAGGRGIVLRFGGFYGPDVPSTRVMLDLARRRMLPIVGRGDFYLPSIHITDAAAAVESALELPAGIYNAVDDEPLRWKDFVKLVAHAAQAPPPLRLPGFLGAPLMGTPWRYMSRSLRLSNAKLKSLTTWRPRTPRARDGYEAVARVLLGPQASKPVLAPIPAGRQ